MLKQGRIMKFNKFPQKSRNTTLLYITHIDWDWIFQRPQIFALKLNDYFNVKILYKYSLFRRNKLQKKSKRPKWYSTYIKIPKFSQSKILRLINKPLEILFVLYNSPRSFNIIWLCHPDLITFIPKNYKGLIVYDCMDDHAEMIKNDCCRDLVLKNEIELIKKADVIFTSSNILKNKMLCNTKKSEKVFLLRNGFDGKIWSTPDLEVCTKINYKIGYIGTIDDWFNFDILKKSIKEIKNIAYYLIGPCMNDSFKNNESINFIGTVEHDQLYDLAKDFDCLIMPFKINNIVLAVDPVKLYEYISFGKCIISVYYPEIERFRNFVYFYNNEQEFIELIKNKCNDGFKPKYSQKQQKEFLLNNTWQVRTTEIIKIIKDNIN